MTGITTVGVGADAIGCDQADAAHKSIEKMEVAFLVNDHSKRALRVKTFIIDF
jgi:hypothetical protein